MPTSGSPPRRRSRSAHRAAWRVLAARASAAAPGATSPRLRLRCAGCSSVPLSSRLGPRASEGHPAPGDALRVRERAALGLRRARCAACDQGKQYAQECQFRTGARCMSGRWWRHRRVGEAVGRVGQGDFLTSLLIVSGMSGVVRRVRQKLSERLIQPGSRVSLIAARHPLGQG